ncbi:hypothetical protein BKA70DRAFT_1129458 [Coprinopsis sp. MPI-PUGE-AT-0042]|nr:hypothetical protein BKA70DRAFT_1129458 [Coprinopsis sp. MPI-PUGE-AT-0042]
MKGLRGKLDLPHIRLGLYIALVRHASLPPKVLELILATIDPVVAELLFTGLIAMPWSEFVIYSIHKRYENRWVSRFREELVGLGILWLFWMVGTAIATVRIHTSTPRSTPSSVPRLTLIYPYSPIWPNLSWCSSFSPCQVLSALLAFCWLGWIALTALLVITLIFVVVNKTWTEPLHGKWDPGKPSTLDVLAVSILCISGKLCTHYLYLYLHISIPMYFSVLKVLPSHGIESRGRGRACSEGRDQAPSTHGLLNDHYDVDDDSDEIAAYRLWDPTERNPIAHSQIDDEGRLLTFYPFIRGRIPDA